MTFTVRNYVNKIYVMEFGVLVLGRTLHSGY